MSSIAVTFTGEKSISIEQIMNARKKLARLWYTKRIPLQEYSRKHLYLFVKKKKNQNPKATSKFHQVPKLSSYVRYLIWFSMGKILFGWFETMSYKEYDKTWRKLSSSEIELSPLSSSLVFRSVSVCGQQRRPRIQAEI